MRIISSDSMVSPPFLFRWPTSLYLVYAFSTPQDLLVIALIRAILHPAAVITTFMFLNYCILNRIPDGVTYQTSTMVGDENIGMGEHC